MGSDVHPHQPGDLGASLQAIERRRSQLLLVSLVVTGGLSLAMALLQLGGGQALAGTALGGSLAFEAAPPLLVAGFSLYILEKEARLRELTRQLVDHATAVSKLAHQASHDFLTQLPNRSAFLERLEDALDRQRRHPGALAVLFLDLDGFKQVNDSLGHEAGDALLVETATRLRACLRRHEVAARFGGDEFTVLAEEVRSTAQAEALSQRIHAALEAPVAIGDEVVGIEASIGIVVHEGGRASATDLLHRADLAMYVAKQRGPGQSQLLDPRVLQDLQSLAERQAAPVSG